MSILWRHFTDEGSAKVRCNYCSIIVSYKKGNRSIMRKHLERKHPETLGITTQAMTQDTFVCGDDEQIGSVSGSLAADIHQLFQIESNVQYFILMVFERPTLYEYSRLIGWNSKQNKIIWQEIADTFQVDVGECQKFWKYLKETYDLHSRNPKLDDHKYAKELEFLGEMYKKRRQRKEELAKQRKLLRSLENAEESLIEITSNRKGIEFPISEELDEEISFEQNQKTLNITPENNFPRKNGTETIENYQIFEEYNVDLPPLQVQINDVSHYTGDVVDEYATGDVNEFIMKDIRAEDIVVFDADSSLIDSSVIIKLETVSTQTYHSGPIDSNNIDKNTNLVTSTKCKKCCNDFDELDLLMEFIKGKIRKFPVKDMNKLQIKILKTVMEAEKDIKTFAD